MEVNDQRYKLHLNEKIILRRRDKTKLLRTQYQVQNETQFRRNQRVVENNGKLGVKFYPKIKQPITQQRKINLPSCFICKGKIG